MVDFNEIGNKIKSQLAVEEKGVPPSPVTTNIKETTKPVAPPVSAQAPANNKPAEKPTAPKTLRVKVDGVEQEVPEDKIIEYGTKYFGLEGHFTRKGQELSNMEKELARRADEIAKREIDVQKGLEIALSKRDETRRQEESIAREERELRELEEADPVQARLVKANRQLKAELDSVKSTVQQELEEIKRFKDYSITERQAEREQQLLNRLEDAAQKNQVDSGDIIGYMAKHPEIVDPYVAAEKKAEEIKNRVEDEIRRRSAESSGNANSRLRTNTPVYQPTGEKPPNFIKDKQGAVKFLVDRLNNIDDNFAR